MKFSDGLPKRERRETMIYPEELLDKKCGGCMRCMERDHMRGDWDVGYHCTIQNYKKDISPEDKACVHYWDKAKEMEWKRQQDEDIENRRKELWAIYAKKPPIKLPIVNDGWGRIPECPVCGEMPYDLDQCHWCGQRFIRDEEVVEYSKPWVEEFTCPSCGTKGMATRSRYNGHRHFHCENCGMSFME